MEEALDLSSDRILNKNKMDGRPVCILIALMPNPRLELQTVAGYSIIIKRRTLWAQTVHATEVAK